MVAISCGQRGTKFTGKSQGGFKGSAQNKQKHRQSRDQFLEARDSDGNLKRTKKRMIDDYDLDSSTNFAARGPARVTGTQDRDNNNFMGEAAGGLGVDQAFNKTGSTRFETMDFTRNSNGEYATSHTGGQDKYDQSSRNTSIGGGHTRTRGQAGINGSKNEMKSRNGGKLSQKSLGKRASRRFTKGEKKTRHGVQKIDQEKKKYLESATNLDMAYEGEGGVAGEANVFNGAKGQGQGDNLQAAANHHSNEHSTQHDYRQQL